MADTQDRESEDVGGYMLTTVDNPFNPFTEWKEWFAFDERKGYHTCGLLARVTITSDELSEYDQRVALADAINEIVQENVSGMHRKVSRETAEELIRR